MEFRLPTMRHARGQICAVFAAAFLPLSAGAGATAWPMFRGNPSLTGVSQAVLPVKLTSAWTFKTQGPVKSSAAIVNGQVFIGSGDGNLYALDLQSGKKQWAFKTEGPIES